MNKEYNYYPIFVPLSTFTTNKHKYLKNINKKSCTQGDG